MNPKKWIKLKGFLSLTLRERLVWWDSDTGERKSLIFAHTLKCRWGGMGRTPWFAERILGIKKMGISAMLQGMVQA